MIEEESFNEEPKSHIYVIIFKFGCVFTFFVCILGVLNPSDLQTLQSCLTILEDSLLRLKEVEHERQT